MLYKYFNNNNFNVRSQYYNKSSFDIVGKVPIHTYTILIIKVYRLYNIFVDICIMHYTTNIYTFRYSYNLYKYFFIIIKCLKIIHHYMPIRYSSAQCRCSLLIKWCNNNVWWRSLVERWNTHAMRWYNKQSKYTLYMRIPEPYIVNKYMYIVPIPTRNTDMKS